MNSEQNELCFIDVETTGAIFGYHEIIDIGVVRTSCTGQEVINTWSRKVRPVYPERITSVARRINGYNSEEWATAAPQSRETWEEFVEFSGGCTPVAHNASFDRAFVVLAAAQFYVTELKLDHHWIGTETLAWPFYASGELARISLSSLCEFLDVSPEPEKHTGLEGAKLSHRIYCALMKRLASMGVQSN